MSLFQFARDDNPKPRERLTPIISVGATDQITATIVAECVWGIHTHWWHGGTVPHTDPVETCGYCSEKAPRKWRGFLHVVTRPAFNHGFLELTDFAYERLLAVKGARQTLRGLIVLFHRERKTVKSPVVMTYVGEEPPGKILPKARTPEKTLKRLWRLPG